MVFANGKKYEGDWVEGIQQGVGTIDELDGYTYTGKFNNGLKNGYFCKTKKTDYSRSYEYYHEGTRQRPVSLNEIDDLKRYYVSYSYL